METVTSRKHPAVQQAAALLKSAQQRRETGLFLAEGARLCADAAESGVEIERCFFTLEAEEKYGRYLGPVLEAARERFCVAPHAAELLSDTKHPQGVFCVCAVPKPRRALWDAPRALVLEDVQDPSNVGGVLRTAEALGVPDVCFVGACCDPFSPKVVRGSMGAVFRLALHSFPEPSACADRLREAGFRLFAAVPTGGEDITAVGFSGEKCAAWVGNEGNGLSKDALARADRRITIPMAGRAESLNASVAGAIVLWEMVRGEKRGKTDG